MGSQEAVYFALVSHYMDHMMISHNIRLTGRGRTHRLIVCLILLCATCSATLLLASQESLDFRLFLHQGHRCMKAGEYRKARDYFARAIMRGLSSAEARFAFSDALMALGQYQGSVEQLRFGISLDASWPSLDYSRYANFGDPADLDRLVDDLKKHAEMMPKDVGVHVLLGYNLFHMNQLPAAYSAFEKVRELAPEDSVAKLYLKEIGGRGFLPTREGGASEGTSDSKKDDGGAGSKAPPSPQQVMPTPGTAGPK